ncbi:4Fe-4S cluster-binding domain-containing protein [Rhodospirillum sp. A1_3_36]|uniref:4Fe-4S cluster-binding domain-containing protein n=1 Tax=Rhodospirillum sp. A1_3_36 TaxID=3391666 RepID=UPI0039A739FD
MSSLTVELRLGHPLEDIHPTLSNGPGWRIPFWTQGCSLRCTAHCLNPNFLEPSGGWIRTVVDIVGAIQNVIENSPHSVEGITMLGGEPTDQAEAVTFLFRAVRSLGLSTFLYSGMSLDQLYRRHGALLAETDLVMDGHFDPKRYSETASWRGSDNQRLHSMGSRYEGAELDAAFRRQGKSASVRLAPNGAFSISGLQSPKSLVHRSSQKVHQSVR